MGGHATVSGGEARELGMQVGNDGVPAMTLSADNGLVNVTDSVGGTLGGLLSAHEATRSYLVDLDTFAADLADALNAQHGAGFDQTGAAGADLFAYHPGSPAATLSFSDAILADPDLLAFAADPAAEIGDTGNLDALLALESTGVVAGQSGGEFISGLTTRVGTELAAARSLSEQQAAIVEDLDALAVNIEGVDLDEEAANLILFQTTDEMIGTLLEIA